jgi:hypothetical protein
MQVLGSSRLFGEEGDSLEIDGPAKMLNIEI